MQWRAQKLRFGSASLRIFVIFALLLALQARAADAPITVETLLRKMSDPRWLADPPVPGEQTVQFSSYDRATRLEGGKIINPFANGDAGHYLRVDGMGDQQEWVLAEAQGPGYVSRIWSANPDGELRIYIDGSPTPALAAPFAAITNGEIAPFAAPFGHDASRGRNLYFPFPFAKSIKITTTKGKQYFQVSVTSLPAKDECRELLGRGLETSRTGAGGDAPPATSRANPSCEAPQITGASSFGEHTGRAVGRPDGGSCVRSASRRHHGINVQGRRGRPRRRSSPHATGDHLRRSRTAPGGRSPGRFLWLGPRCQCVRVVDKQGSK